jgi:hypothetical protein
MRGEGVSALLFYAAEFLLHGFRVERRCNPEIRITAISQLCGDIGQDGINAV